MDRGVFYVAYGKKFVEEAVLSAKSVKECMPSLSISIASDIDPNSEVFDNLYEIDVDKNKYTPTFLFLDKSPYDKTIHFDTDVYVNGSVYEIFDMMEKWDLLATHAPYREQTDVGIPSAFPEINGGVLAFNNNKYFKKFYSNWKRNYRKIGRDTEQPSLRKTLYESDMDFYILPPEYNARDIGYLHGEAKIFHFREYTNLERTMEKINSTEEQRVYYHSWRGVKVIENRHPISARIWKSVNEKGIIITLKKGLNRIMRSVSS